MKSKDTLSLVLVLIAIGLVAYQFSGGKLPVPIPPAPQTPFQEAWKGERTKALQMADALEAIVAQVQSMPVKPSISQLAAIVRTAGKLLVDKTGQRMPEQGKAAVVARVKDIQQVDAWLAEVTNIVAELRGVAP